MKKLKLIIPLAGTVLFLISGPSAFAYKVGDSCTPHGGGAGHFVKSGITIKCQADAAIIKSQITSPANDQPPSLIPKKPFKNGDFSTPDDKPQ